MRMDLAQPTWDRVPRHATGHPQNRGTVAKHAWKMPDYTKLRTTLYCRTSQSLEDTTKNLNLPGQGFPAGSVVKNPPANAGDMNSIPDPGRFHMLQSN